MFRITQMVDNGRNLFEIKIESPMYINWLLAYYQTENIEYITLDRFLNFSVC